MKLKDYITELQEYEKEYGGEVEVLAPVGKPLPENGGNAPSGWYGDPDLDILCPNTKIATIQLQRGCRCGSCREHEEFRQRPVLITTVFEW